MDIPLTDALTEIRAGLADLNSCRDSDMPDSRAVLGAYWAVIGGFAYTKSGEKVIPKEETDWSKLFVRRIDIDRGIAGQRALIEQRRQATGGIRGNFGVVSVGHDNSITSNKLRNMENGISSRGDRNDISGNDIEC